MGHPPPDSPQRWENEAVRLFVALPLPAEVHEHLELAVAALGERPRPGGPSPLRWVPPEQRHVTLAFYGEVPEGAVPGLTRDLAAALAGRGPLRLRLRGAGVFSRRTLWVGVQELDGADLTGLMAACENAGVGVVRMDRRERHRGHVTIARLSARRPVAEELAERGRALSVYAGPPWTATHAVLVASELGAGRGGGPRYETLAELPLEP